MSSNKRAPAWAATLVVSFVNVGIVSAQEPEPAEAPAGAEPKPTSPPAKAEEKPKPKPRPRVVAPAPAQAPAAKPAVSDEATRLRRVEAALRGAGLLAPQDDAKKKELAELKEQLAKLEEQKKSLEAAIKGGLDAESVKPALAGLSKKELELKERIAKLEAEQPAPAEAAAKSALGERLDTLEANIAALQKQQAASTGATVETVETATTATSEEPAHALTEHAKAEPGEAKPTGRAGWKDGFFIESEDGSYSLKPSGFLDFKFGYATHHGEDRGIGAGAQRQQDDGDHGKAGPPEDVANG